MTQLKDVYLSEGVRDLPTEARKQFALALVKESDGKTAEAEQHLAKAVEAANAMAMVPALPQAGAR